MENSRLQRLSLNLSTSEITSCLCRIKFLVEGVGSENELNEFGFTPLHEAAFKKCLRCVRAILDHNPDPNIQNFNDGKSAFHVAVESGSSQIVKMILDRASPDFGLRDFQGFNALHFAADAGNAFVTKFTFSAMPHLVNVLTKRGRSALHLSAMNGHTGVANVLLRLGKADLDLQDNEGSTPLMLAIANGHVDLVEMIMKFEPKLDIQNHDGNAAIHLAIEKNSIAIIEMLVRSGIGWTISNKQGFTALQYAAVKGMLLAVELFLTRLKSELVDFRNEDGFSALHLAAQHGNLFVVDLLLQSGKADIDLPCNQNCTPLLVAVKNGHIDVAFKILKYQPNLNLQNVEGATALHLAVKCRLSKLTELIMSCPSIDLSLRDNTGFTLFHFAAMAGDLSLTELLINKNVTSVDTKNNDGNSALHIAAFEGHKYIAIALVIFGKANINITNNKSQTPLMLAVERDDKHLVKFMVLQNLDVNAQDNGGNTALHIAVKNGNEEVFEELARSNQFVDFYCVNQEGFNVFHLAAKMGYISIVKRLVELDPILVNTSDHNRLTGLHHATQLGNVAMAEIIVNSGKANLNSFDGQNRTPLMAAVEKDHVNVVTMLLKHSPNVNAQNEDGNTALHIAVNKGFLNIIDLIKGYPTVDLFCQNKFGNNAFHSAVIKGKVNAITALLDAKPEFASSMNGNGFSALHLVAINGQKDLANILLKSGFADVNLLTANSQSSLMLALEHGKKEMAKVLIESQADVNIQDPNNNSALHKGIERQDDLTVELLLSCPTINLQLKNKSNFTPLFLAAKSGYVFAVQLIMQKNPSLVSDGPLFSNALYIAAKNGHRDVVEILMGYGICRGMLNLQVGKVYPPTPWTVAAYENHKDVIEVFLKHQTDINVRDDVHKSALDYAIDAGAHEVTEFLINQPVLDLFSVDDYGNNALHVAVLRVNTVAIELILNKKPLLIDVKSNSGVTPLLFAAGSSNDSVVKILLTKGKANVDLVNNWNDSPLMLAVDSGCLDVIKVIMGFAPNVNIQNKDGNTALHYAVYKQFTGAIDLIGNYPCVDMNLRNNDGFNILQLAAARGYLIAVEMILKKDPKLVFVKMNAGLSALHLAARSGHSAVVEYLMLHQPSVKSLFVDQQHKTPLMYALESDVTGVALTVLKFHPDLNVQDIFGNTALHIALANHHNEAITQIIESPLVNLNLADKNGYTPLHLAALVGNVAAEKLLIQKNPSLILRPANDGFTALHCAALGGHKDVADLLLNFGPTLVNLKDKLGRSPLMLACTQLHASIIELLVEKGADLAAVDMNKDAVLHKLFVGRTQVPELGLASSPNIFRLYEELNKRKYFPMPCEGTSSRQGNVKNLVWEKECYSIAAYLVQQGAALTLKNKEKKTCGSFVGATWANRLRTFAPSNCNQAKKRPSSHSGECLVCSEMSTEIIMFEPCGHKIACHGCSSRMKKCVSCRELITKWVKSDGSQVVYSLGSSSNDTVQSLQTQVQRLEESVRCTICVERAFTIVFPCGHSACEVCSSRLKHCHICRAAINKKTRLFR